MGNTLLHGNTECNNRSPHFSHTWLNFNASEKKKTWDGLTEHRQAGYPNHAIFLVQPYHKLFVVSVVSCHIRSIHPVSNQLPLLLLGGLDAAFGWQSISSQIPNTSNNCSKCETFSCIKNCQQLFQKLRLEIMQGNQLVHKPTPVHFSRCTFSIEACLYCRNNPGAPTLY